MTHQPTLTSADSLMKPSLVIKLSAFAADIKIAHTIFAMPFALLSTFMASRAYGRWPDPIKLGLILVCMVTARTVAMAVNRLLDARLDSLNARTAGRAIPSGRLSVRFYVAATMLCCVVFIGATAGFLWFGNSIPLICSVPVLAFLSGYPLLKRFTRLCHYYLGVALALAPVCAWVAITGRLATPPLWMAGAVVCWTAGFDIIYACQDYASDVATGVFSVPSKLGIAAALWVSRFTHVVCVAMLITLGLSTPLLGTLYFVGVGLAACLLVIEQSMVSKDDISRANLAFFTFNGVISVLLGTLGIIDVLRR